jgi:hypothetical protein
MQRRGLGLREGSRIIPELLYLFTIEQPVLCLHSAIVIVIFSIVCRYRGTPALEGIPRRSNGSLPGYVRSPLCQPVVRIYALSPHDALGIQAPIKSNKRGKPQGYPDVNETGNLDPGSCLMDPLDCSKWR